MNRDQLRTDIEDRQYEGSYSEATDKTGPRHYTFDHLSAQFDRDIVDVIAIEADRIGVSSLAFVATALERHPLSAVNAFIQELSQDS